MRSRIHIALLVLLGRLLCQTSHGFAPRSMPTRTIPTTSLIASRQPSSDHHHNFVDSATKDSATWIKDCQTVMAGLIVGGVLVFSPAFSWAAAPEASASMHLAAGSFETLDFSLPSYGDSTGSSTAGSKKDIPSFNPFGDFEPTIVKPAEQDSAAKQAEQEKVAVAKEQAKAEAEAKRAAEVKARQAAAEAARAEKEAEVKARQATVEAARAEKEALKATAETAATTAAPTSLELPEIKIPEMKMPEIPDITIPDIKLPDFKLPEFTAPKLPSSFKMPELSAPQLPSSFKMPELSAPKLPDGSAVRAPKFNVPEVTMPNMPELNLPKISFPAISNPFGGGGGGDSASSTGQQLSTSQSVRDEAAKAARLNYLDADQAAKDAEAKAREVRQAAEEQKKLANLAKDQACETRPGGKWICLRNPFNVGY